jgi:hypothetical protein
VANEASHYDPLFSPFPNEASAQDEWPDLFFLVPAVGTDVRVAEEAGGGLVSRFGDWLVGHTAADEATAARGWRLGDPIDALTRAGNAPAWSTVRARYWKNAAATATSGEYSVANLARMQRGLAPQEDGVSMELHHILPRRFGGDNSFQNLEPLWPDEHAAVDPFRHLGGSS